MKIEYSLEKEFGSGAKTDSALIALLVAGKSAQMKKKANQGWNMLQIKKWFLGKGE